MLEAANHVIDEVIIYKPNHSLKKEFMLEAVNDITDRVKGYKTIKITSRTAYYYSVLLNGNLMEDNEEFPLQEGRNIITVPDKSLMSMLTVTVELK